MTGKPEPRVLPIPMDRAILWNPATQEGRNSGRAPYPIFFQQQAIYALQEHLKASPQQAIFGFLAGDLYRDPEVGVLFAVIDKTLRLNQPIYGDKTDVVVARLWDRMQERLAQAQGRLLGWYHSHPGHGLTLSSHDVETHQKYFNDPWQVAVLVAADEGDETGALGAFFRAGGAGGVDWPSTPLSFYELLQPASIASDGKKRSFIMWKNYKAFTPTVPKREGPPLVKTSLDDDAVPSARERTAPVFVPRAEPPAPQAMPPEPFPPKPSPLAPAPAPQAMKPEPFPVKPSPLAPAPAPPPPRHAPPPPPPARPQRRRSGPSFRLLDERAPRRSRRGLWLTLLALLLVVGGGAAAGYWYYVLREPGTPLPFGLDRVFGGGGRGSAAPVVPADSQRPARDARPAVQPPESLSAPTLDLPAVPPIVDTTFARFDRLADTLSAAIANYHERAALFASGQIACAGLARGLVAMEDLWIAYNAERRERISAFDLARAGRDQSLYQRVDSVETRFEQTRCPRP